MSLTKIVGPSLGVVEVTSLSGNGTPLTSLNASSLLSGTVPVARLSSANSSVGGIVDIVAQTFAGAKTFTSNATFSGSRTFFASGSVLDWNSGDVTLTHSANTLTFGGASSGYVFNDGSLAWGGGSAITSSTDVVQVTGAQTISGGKTFSSVTGTNFTVTANTPHIIDIRNLSDGSGASSRVRIGNNSSIEGVVLAAFGSAHSSFPNRSRVVTSLINGMDIGAEDASGVIRFYAGGSERTRIGADGNVGIGVTPGSWNSNYRALQVGTSSLMGRASGDDTAYFNVNTVFGASGWTYINSGLASRFEMLSGGHSFYTAPSGTAGNAITWTERFRILNGGNIAIGATARLYLDGVAGTGDTYILAPVNDRIDIVTGGSAHLFNTTGFAAAAYPTTASAANLYSSANGDYIYRSTSSIRYKHDIATLDTTDALSAVMAMRPVTYRGKTDADQRRYVGFVAEEMQQWAPLLCTYDDGGESGTPNYVTYDRVTAYLVAVVQRQQKEIDDLKLRLSKRDV